MSHDATHQSDMNGGAEHQAHSDPAPETHAGASHVLAELMEQRMALETRLLDFDAALKQLKAARLPVGVAPAVADFQRAVERFDSDLTRLANVVHDLSAELERRALLQADAPRLEAVIFVRAGGRTLAIRAREVAEIRAVSSGAKNREGEIVSLSGALSLPQAPPNAHQRLLMLAGAESGMALLVDDIIRQDEVIIRTLGPLLAGQKMFSGAAVAPRGELVLMVNTRGLRSSVLEV